MAVNTGIPAVQSAPAKGGAVRPRVFPALMRSPTGALVFFGPASCRAAGRCGRAFGPFFVGGRVDTALHDRLIARFEPILLDLGYELVEIEFVPGPGGGTLRIYIDKADEGIDVEDCASVS